MFKSRMKKEDERQIMFARKISWQLYLELSKVHTNISLFPLERWYVDYSHWWEQKDPKEDLLTYQEKFPKYKMFILDWKTLDKKLKEFEENRWLGHEGC